MLSVSVKYFRFGTVKNTFKWKTENKLLIVLIVKRNYVKQNDKLYLQIYYEPNKRK